VRYVSSWILGLCGACSPILGPPAGSGPTKPICWECPPANDTAYSWLSVLRIEKTATASGDSQTGTVGAALPNVLRVQAIFGLAVVQGDTVTWAASGTGASVSPTKSVTDAGGIATTSWTLGRTVGAQTATATLGGAVVTFTATATPGP
jgi:hypothetical protein